MKRHHILLMLITSFGLTCMGQNETVPDLPKDWYQSGKDFYKELQFDSAVMAFDSAVYHAVIQNDTSRQMNAMSRMALAYLQLEQYSESENFFLKTLNLELVIGDSIRIAKGYNNVGIVKYYKSEWDSCLFYYQKALTIYRKTSQNTLPQFIKNIGQVYRKKGDFENAATHFFEAAQMFEKRNDKEEAASIYNSIGNMYNESGYDSLSLYYHNQSLNIRQSLGNHLATAQSLNNVANIIRKAISPDSALALYQRAFAITEEFNNDRLKSAILNNIGEIYLDRQEVKRGKEYFLRSLELKNSLEDLNGMAYTKHNLARVYMLEKQDASAEKEIRQGLEIAKKIGAPDLVLKFYGSYAYLLSSAQRYEEATKYYKVYTELKDSLLSNFNVKAYSETEIKYRTAKLKQEVEFLRPLENKIEILNLQTKNQASRLKAQRILTWAIGSGLFLLTCLLIVIWRNLNQRKRIANLLALKNQEISHRVKNNLSVLISIFSGQSRETDNEELKVILHENEHRIKVISHLHDRLSNEAYDNLSTKLYFEGLIDDLLFTYNYSKSKCLISIDSIELDIDKALHIGLILNELVTNALKHGLSNMSNPFLEISLSDGLPNIELLVKDNGPGIQPELQMKWIESQGMRLVDKLVNRQLEGSLTYEYREGALFRVIIPK